MPDPNTEVSTTVGADTPPASTIDGRDTPWDFEHPSVSGMFALSSQYGDTHPIGKSPLFALAGKKMSGFAKGLVLGVLQDTADFQSVSQVHFSAPDGSGSLLDEGVAAHLLKEQSDHLANRLLSQLDAYLSEVSDGAEEGKSGRAQRARDLLSPLRQGVHNANTDELIRSVKKMNEFFVDALPKLNTAVYPSTDVEVFNDDLLTIYCHGPAATSRTWNKIMACLRTQETDIPDSRSTWYLDQCCRTFQANAEEHHRYYITEETILRGLQRFPWENDRHMPTPWKDYKTAAGHFLSMIKQSTDSNEKDM